MSMPSESTTRRHRGWRALALVGQVLAAAGIIGFVAICFFLSKLRGDHWRHIDSFNSRFQQAVDPEDLRAWAVEVLKTNGIGAEIELADVPKQLPLESAPFSRV